MSNKIFENLKKDIAFIKEPSIEERQRRFRNAFVENLLEKGIFNQHFQFVSDAFLSWMSKIENKESDKYKFLNQLSGSLLKMWANYVNLESKIEMVIVENLELKDEINEQLNYQKENQDLKKEIQTLKKMIEFYERENNTE